MVRLRSERWYSSAGQQRSRTFVAARSRGTRRLFSLCFLLFLVLLLMQQAADPAHVANFFQALGVPLDEQPEISISTDEPSGVTTARDSATGDRSQGEEDSSESHWRTTVQDLIPRLLEEATEPQIRELCQHWFLNERDPPSSALLDLRDQADQELSDIGEKLAGDDLLWRSALDRFRREWASCWVEILDEDRDQPNVGQFDAHPSELVAETLTAYLDQRLIGALRDGAPWESEEQVAFWRLLQRGGGWGRGGMASSGAPSVHATTLQLESEFADLKGSMVRFHGSIRRAEHVSRPNVAIGPDGYWVMWLRGADQALQPVAVYSADGEIADIAGEIDGRNDDFPDVEIQGVVAKRMAYASPSGLQVAPTLFAFEVRRVTAPANVVTGGNRARLHSDMTRALVIGVAVTVFLLLALFAGWQRRPKPSQGRTRRSQNLTGGLLLFALLPTTVLGQGIVPPWAAPTSADTWSDMFQEQVREVDMQGLEAYLTDRGGRFPDGLLKLHHRMSQFGWERVVSHADAVSLAEGLQLGRLSLIGSVERAQVVTLTGEQQMWFGIDEDQRLYELRIRPLSNAESTAQNHPESPHVPASEDAIEAARSKPNLLVRVFCRRAPSQWIDGRRLPQTARIHGMSLFRSEREHPLCLLADDVEWMVKQNGTSGPLMLPPHQVALGRLGWNLAWLDQVAEQYQQPLADFESEPLFSLMSYAAQSPMASGDPPTHVNQDALQVMAKPIESIGQPVRWQVRLVQGRRIQVESPGEAELLGRDRYFQFDGFVDIGNRRISYQLESGDIDFDREFPVTIVTTQAAPFLPSGSEAADWPVGRFAILEGWYYRMWSYHSQLLEDQRQAGRQAAPLVVATALVPSTPPARTATNPIGWFGYALCVAVISIMAAIVYLAWPSAPALRRR